MNWYEKNILPKLIHWACSQKDITRQRRAIVPQAQGRVLEVGIGSGLNLPFFDYAKVECLWGLDPSQQLIETAQKKAAQLSLDARFLGVSGEDIPLDTNSMDTVLLTYTLCSILNAKKALTEMRRVLKPGGTLLFCEHGKAPDENVRFWQDRINPVWRKVAGGCHLNRPISTLITEAGFEIKFLKEEYNSSLKIVSYNYRGVAVIDE